MKGLLNKLRLSHSPSSLTESSVLSSRANDVTGIVSNWAPLAQQSCDVLEDPFGSKLTSLQSTIDGTSDTLNAVNNTLNDTENIGINVINTMNMQKSQLLSTRDNLDETRNIAERSKRVLKEMGRRTIRNKIFLYAVIVTLGAIDGWLVYRAFKK